MESTKHYSQQLNIRLTKYWRWLRWRLPWRQKKRSYFRWKILENMSFIMIFKYLLLIREKSNYQYHKKKIIHFKRINFNDWNFLKCLKYLHLSKNLLKKVVQILFSILDHFIRFFLVIFFLLLRFIHFELLFRFGLIFFRFHQLSFVHSMMESFSQISL